MIGASGFPVVLEIGKVASFLLLCGEYTALKEPHLPSFY